MSFKMYTDKIFDGGYTRVENEAIKFENWYKENVVADMRRREREEDSRKIKQVIFHDPATIVYWKDGSKTVVKCGEGEEFDPEKGLAMACAKRLLGKSSTQGDYYEEFKKWLPEQVVYEYDITNNITDSLKKLAICDLFYNRNKKEG